MVAAATHEMAMEKENRMSTIATTHPTIDNRARAVPQFRFADACAGLGGFHLALSSVGGECVWACETNPLARDMYEVNFARTAPRVFTSGNFHADITADIARVPDFDLLACGLPCQPFTSAGKRLGLHDSRSGVITHLARVLEAKQPRAFLFENVRGLVYRDQRRAFDYICHTISDIGYSFHHKVLRACDYGVPQYRHGSTWLASENHPPRSSGLPESHYRSALTMFSGENAAELSPEHCSPVSQENRIGTQARLTHTWWMDSHEGSPLRKWRGCKKSLIQ